MRIINFTKCDLEGGGGRICPNWRVSGLVETRGARYHMETGFRADAECASSDSDIP